MRGDEVEEFVTFARHVHSCRKNVEAHKRQLECIRSLFEASMNIEPLLSRQK